MSIRPTQRSTSRKGVAGRFVPRSAVAGATEVRAYKGKVTTTGSSKAVRLGKQFFTDHPEFEVSADVVVRSVSPGYVLMAVESPRAIGQKSDELDPVVGAFLSFMEADLRANPHKVQPLDLSRVAALVEGVLPLRDDEVLPADFAL
ncbi:type II toxin-antitoxin system PrlF family antitoxin [Phenylobacterium sp.]|uniref:type II toxin-antitoxin system PrlF family antitoxin n=1 Tax=Phenylobacterium sp. TaxID=1871053 RepID=UPI002F405B70